MTVPVLVVLFAVCAFIAAGLEARAFGSAKTRPVIVHLLLASAGLAAGVVALVWPGRAEVSKLEALGVEVAACTIAARASGQTLPALDERDVAKDAP